MQKKYLMLRIKEVARKKGKKLDDVSKGLGICYSSLYRRVDNPKFSTLQEIANFLNCPIQELIEAPEGYAHFYDDKSGEWLGIRKK